MSPNPCLRDPDGRFLPGALWVLWAVLTGGCATTPRSVPPSAPLATAPTAVPVPVVRYGRYTLVELTPTAAQTDLLAQVVDVTVPATAHDSVGDALRYVLLRSGYRLCDGRETDALDRLPLPAAHYQMGPLSLRDALQLLAGPVRALQVDEGTRQVCFADTRPAPPEAPLAVPDADRGAEIFPLAAERGP